MFFKLLSARPAADTRLETSKGSMFKKRRQKGFLRALLCCFFRPEVAQEAQKPAQDAGSEVGAMERELSKLFEERWLFSKGEPISRANLESQSRSHSSFCEEGQSKISIITITSFFFSPPTLPQPVSRRIHRQIPVTSSHKL